jgi:hypothetical protein
MKLQRYSVVPSVKACSLLLTLGFPILALVSAMPLLADDAAAKARATNGAGSNFVAPQLDPPTIDKSLFKFQDVGAKIPNYTPGEKWGTQGQPLTLMQEPLPAELSVTAYAVPQGFRLALWAKEADSYWPHGSQPAT